LDFFDFAWLICLRLGGLQKNLMLFFFLTKHFETLFGFLVHGILEAGKTKTNALLLESAKGDRIANEPFKVEIFVATTVAGLCETRSTVAGLCEARNTGSKSPPTNAKRVSSILTNQPLARFYFASLSLETNRSQ